MMNGLFHLELHDTIMTTDTTLKFNYCTLAMHFYMGLKENTTFS